MKTLLGVYFHKMNLHYQIEVQISVPPLDNVSSSYEKLRGINKLLSVFI